MLIKRKAVTERCGLIHVDCALSACALSEYINKNNDPIKDLINT